MVSGGPGSATAVDSSMSLSESISTTGVALNPDGRVMAVVVSSVLLVTAAVVWYTLGTDDMA
jgi:hypothetical protein